MPVPSGLEICGSPIRNARRTRSMKRQSRSRRRARDCVVGSSRWQVNHKEYSRCNKSQTPCRLICIHTLLLLWLQSIRYTQDTSTLKTAVPNKGGFPQRVFTHCHHHPAASASGIEYPHQPAAWLPPQQHRQRCVGVVTQQENAPGAGKLLATSQRYRQCALTIHCLPSCCGFSPKFNIPVQRFAAEADVAGEDPS